MQRTIYFFILFVFTFSCATAQKSNYFKRPSPYQFNWKKDVPLSLGAAGLYAWGSQTLKNEERPNFTSGSFTQTDIDNLNFLDRGAAGNWNPTAKNIGKPFVYVASTGIPLGLLALPGNLKSRATLALMFYEGYYLTGGLVTLAKGSTNRYRPFTYLSESQISALEEEAKTEFLEDIEGSDIEDSFFSGDAAKTAYGFIFFAKAFQDYYPDSRLTKAVWWTSIAAIGVQGVMRVRSGKHFPTDVLVGSLVGGGIGYLIPHLHQNSARKDRRLGLNTSNDGLSLTYQLR